MPKQLIIGPETVSVMKVRGAVGLYNQPLYKMNNYRPAHASYMRAMSLYRFSTVRAQYRGRWHDNSGLWREAIWK